MPDLKTYRVFVSHAWTYNSEYYKIEQMLDDTPLLLWHNYSVPEHDPKICTIRELTRALENQIRPTNIVLILSGMYVSYSSWIQTEIDIATRMGKPIVGIIPWGSQKTPVAVQNVANEMVNWNTYSIVQAIRRNAL